MELNLIIVFNLNLINKQIEFTYLKKINFIFLLFYITIVTFILFIQKSFNKKELNRYFKNISFNIKSFIFRMVNKRN
jgi:c-di-AMP phosphodiesterase-like protein